MNVEGLFQAFPTLETERLILRELDSERDAPVLFETLYNDNDITQFDGSRVFEVGSDGFSIIPTMRSKMNLWEKGFYSKRLIVWGIELKASGELIGIRYCELFSVGIANLECKLNKNYWQQGYMTEASRAIIGFLEFNDVRQIVTTINRRNTAALALDKKLEFVEIDANELYFPQNVQGAEALSLSALRNLIQQGDERIFVKPKINPIAFSYFENACEARNSNDLRRCAQLSLKSIEAQPDFVHAMNGLGWALLDLGTPNDAIEIFNRTIALKPDKFTAYLGRAYAFSDLHQFNEASNDILAYLKLQPSDGDTWTMAGNLLFRAKRIQESITAYDNAITLNPNNLDAKQYKNTALGYL